MQHAGVQSQHVVDIHGNKVLGQVSTLRYRWESSYVRCDETGVLVSRNEAQEEKITFHVLYNLK